MLHFHVDRCKRERSWILQKQKPDTFATLCLARIGNNLMAYNDDELMMMTAVMMMMMATAWDPMKFFYELFFFSINYKLQTCVRNSSCWRLKIPSLFYRSITEFQGY